MFLLFYFWWWQRGKKEKLSHVRLFGSPWNYPGKNTGVSSLSLLQETFPSQGSNSGLPHCRWICYQLSHKGSPRRLEWVAYPFSSGSPNTGIELGSPALQVASLLLSYQGSPQSSRGCSFFPHIGNLMSFMFSETCVIFLVPSTVAQW